MEQPPRDSSSHHKVPPSPRDVLCPGDPKGWAPAGGAPKGGVSAVGTPKGARLPDLTRGQQNAAFPRAGDMGPLVPGAGSHILLGGPQHLPPQTCRQLSPSLLASAEWGAADSQLCLPPALRDAWERPPHGQPACAWQAHRPQHICLVG